MPLHRAYCDESEDSEGRTVFAVCGYLGAMETWRSFQVLWKEALFEERIPAFHASACDGGHDAFHGMPPDRRAALQRRFYSIIRTVLIWGYASAVRLNHYDLVQARIRAVRGELSKAYYLLFQHQIEMMVFAAEDAKIPPDDQIIFAFDLQQEYQAKGKARRLYDSMRGLGESTAVSYSHRLGGLEFVSARDTVQLQAADILAYENMRYLRECYPDHPENERWQWQLLRSSGRMNGRLFDEAQLGDLLKVAGW
jgi:hypothetical protein